MTVCRVAPVLRVVKSLPASSGDRGHGGFNLWGQWVCLNADGFSFFFLLFSRSNHTRGSVPTVSDELSHGYVFLVKQNPLPKVLCHPAPKSPSEVWPSQLSEWGQQLCPPRGQRPSRSGACSSPDPHRAPHPPQCPPGLGWVA